MLKLYKLVDGALRYHEAWVDDDEQSVVEHWGVVGDRGEQRRHPLPKKFREEKLLRDVLAAPRADGYAEFDEDGFATLLVEYAVDGMGTGCDVDRRHALEDRLNDLLGWTGLGWCDGGSIGSGTMEACCFVVDFDKAKDVIARDLAGTEFADFTRIYDEDAEGA